MRAATGGCSNNSLQIEGSESPKILVRQFPCLFQFAAVLMQRSATCLPPRNVHRVSQSVQYADGCIDGRCIGQTGYTTKEKTDFAALLYDRRIRQINFPPGTLSPACSY